MHTIVVLAFLLVCSAQSQSYCTNDNETMKIFEHVDPEGFTLIANIPPPFRQGETAEDRQRVEQMLEYYWKSGSGYYSRTGTSSQGREYTYGEISPLGVRQLARWMKLHDEAVVFDVGSGVGKLVVQLFLEKAASRAIGIENCPIRHGIAVVAWGAIYDQLSPQLSNGSTVEFRNQDARTADYTPATHVFLCSLCFPKQLTDDVIHSLLRSAMDLQVVAALTDLPRLESLSPWKKTMYDIQTTWGQSSLRVYSLER